MAHASSCYELMLQTTSAATGAFASASAPACPTTACFRDRKPRRHRRIKLRNCGKRRFLCTLTSQCRRVDQPTRARGDGQHLGPMWGGGREKPITRITSCFPRPWPTTSPPLIQNPTSGGEVQRPLSGLPFELLINPRLRHDNIDNLVFLPPTSRPHMRRSVSDAMSVEDRQNKPACDHPPCLRKNGGRAISCRARGLFVTLEAPLVATGHDESPEVHRPRKLEQSPPFASSTNQSMSTPPRRAKSSG